MDDRNHLGRRIVIVSGTRRCTGRRETFLETQQAIAALISDRAAKRPTLRAHSTALVLARDAAC
ncbi:hypothetical protein ACFCX0_39200 [Streptomyces sp. NPDC056352]|uniref:hypothetical protein n=1 Tax=Streptomyces sp. NPDC056352 TaxID=3345791 RepID=UPI0035D97B04